MDRVMPTASSSQGWWVGKDGKRYKGDLYVDYSRGKATIVALDGKRIEAYALDIAATGATGDRIAASLKRRYGA